MDKNWVRVRLRRAVGLTFIGSALASVLFCSATAWAQEQSTNLPTNVFSLSASSTGEATNDLMRATVVVEDVGEESAELQSKINASTQWALARLKPFTGIKVETKNYQTYPIYEDKGKDIIGWRASQSLQLETEDVKAAGDAIRKLQERLVVRGIRFEPKPETRRALEDQLINEALDAFKQRAQLIRLNIGAAEYTLLDIDVQTGFQGGQIAQRFQENSVSRASSVAQPGLEAGTSEISVSVRGRIQLGAPQ